MKLNKVIKRLIIICFCLGVAGLLVLIGINALIKGAVQDRIVETESLPDEEFDCIMVLGCQVKEGGLMQEVSHCLHKIAHCLPPNIISLMLQVMHSLYHISNTTRGLPIRIVG